MIDLTFLGPPSGIAQRLEYVLMLVIGVILEQFADRPAAANLSNDHADRYTLAANAGLSTHNSWILANTGKIIQLTSMCKREDTLGRCVGFQKPLRDYSLGAKPQGSHLTLYSFVLGSRAGLNL